MMLYEDIRDRFDILDEEEYKTVKELNSHFEGDCVEVFYSFPAVYGCCCVCWEVEFHWQEDNWLKTERTINVERTVEYNGSSPYAMTMCALLDNMTPEEEDDDEDADDEDDDDEEEDDEDTIITKAVYTPENVEPCIYRFTFYDTFVKELTFEDVIESSSVFKLINRTFKVVIDIKCKKTPRIFMGDMADNEERKCYLFDTSKQWLPEWLHGITENDWKIHKVEGNSEIEIHIPSNSTFLDGSKDFFTEEEIGEIKESFKKKSDKHVCLMLRKMKKTGSFFLCQDRQYYIDMPKTLEGKKNIDKIEVRKLRRKEL